jgi:transporter family-2 protein
MNQFFWILVAFVAGAVLPIQAGFNSNLGKTLKSPIHASMMSFIVGFIAIALFILISKQQVTFSEVKTASILDWMGGLLGAFYVTSIILVFPKLGPGLTFGLIVAGQMLISILLEHFNILVANPHPINLWRILGILLIVIGVVMIRKF